MQSKPAFAAKLPAEQLAEAAADHPDCRNALGPMTNFSPGISEAAYAEVSLIGRIRRTFHMQKFRRSMHLHQWPPMHGLLNRQHCGHHDIVMQIYIYIYMYCNIGFNISITCSWRYGLYKDS